MQHDYFHWEDSLMIKGKIVLTVALLGISIGSLGVTSTTARAKSKYVTTPTSVRGKWFQSYKGSKNTGQYLRITKYTFYVANYMNGHKESGSIRLMMATANKNLAEAQAKKQADEQDSQTHATPTAKAQAAAFAQS